jgi:hypothetical protein
MLKPIKNFSLSTLALAPILPASIQFDQGSAAVQVKWHTGYGRLQQITLYNHCFARPKMYGLRPMVISTESQWRNNRDIHWISHPNSGTGF